MKKIIAILLALTMVLSLGAVAFADGPEANPTGVNIEGTDVGSLTNNPVEIDVSLNADIPTPTPQYYVTVAWQSMQFVYSGATAATTWDHSSHTWSGGTEGSWTTPSSTITITNHSSVGVTIAGSYAPKTEGQYASGTPYNGVTLTFTGPASTSLAAGTPDNASSPGDNQTTASVAVTGTPEKTISEGVVGTVTIRVSAASA